MRRIKPHVEVRRLVANQSSRQGARPVLIVLHATEGHNRPGIADLEALAGWFDNPTAQASSHVATDAEGNSARFVADTQKAWHVAGYNRPSLGIEQMGITAEGTWTRDEIRETARWIAYWSLRHSIPIRVGAVANGTVTRAGVLRHMDLGAIGGGHHDPGPKYPLRATLALARFYRWRLRRQR